MRKITAGLFISLDGVIESPGEWHFPYFNEEMGETVGAQMMAADCMLLGRVTYQEFAGFWPGKTEDEYEGAAYMNGTSKSSFRRRWTRSMNGRTRRCLKATLSRRLRS